MRRTQGEWVRIVARYRASGKTARSFSASEGIGEQSLRNWARKLKGRRAPPTGRTEGFVEIAEVSHLSSHRGEGFGKAAKSGLVIRLESGLRIEVQPDTDRDLLGWLLSLLRQAS